MNAALVLQLLLLLGVLYAKEKFLPNLVLLPTKKKKNRAAIGDGGGTRVKERESAPQEKTKQQQQKPSSSTTTSTTTSRSSVQQAVEPTTAAAAFGLMMTMTRRIIEQDLQQVNQKLDRISNDIHAQYQAIDQKIHAMDVDLQQQGVFIHTNVDDSDEINVSTTSPLFAKIEECFQEWMERLEAISKQVTKTGGGGDDEIEMTKEIMQNVTMELASSLETKMNQVSQNVSALSLGFVVAVTIALATVALPRVVDVTRGLLATFEDE